MAGANRHVLVCTNVDCLGRGSQAVLDELSTRVAAAEATDVDVASYCCFGGCDYGPNVVLYPAKAFYSGVKPQDVDEIMAHLNGDARVDRLTGKVDSAVEELIFELLDADLL